jgi:hypothetical protein
MKPNKNHLALLRTNTSYISKIHFNIIVVYIYIYIYQAHYIIIIAMRPSSAILQFFIINFLLVMGLEILTQRITTGFYDDHVQSLPNHTQDVCLDPCCINLTVHVGLRTIQAVFQMFACSLFNDAFRNLDYTA